MNRLCTQDGCLRKITNFVAKKKKKRKKRRKMRKRLKIYKLISESKKVIGVVGLENFKFR